MPDTSHRDKHDQKLKLGGELMRRYCDSRMPIYCKKLERGGSRRSKGPGPLERPRPDPGTQADRTRTAHRAGDSEVDRPLAVLSGSLTVTLAGVGPRPKPATTTTSKVKWTGNLDSHGDRIELAPTQSSPTNLKSARLGPGLGAGGT